MSKTVVGIDVGGKDKGFHAVAMEDRRVLQVTEDRSPAAIADWCLERRASIVAVDAPCLWSRHGSSRFAESELAKKGIHSFYTPTRATAAKNQFYAWMLNGEKLFRCLESSGYQLFLGGRRRNNVSIETFPNAITLAILGELPKEGSKVQTRRRAVRKCGIDASSLSNIDFVDAALCAAAAEAFALGDFDPIGDREEGFIVVPNFQLA